MKNSTAWIDFMNCTPTETLSRPIELSNPMKGQTMQPARLLRKNDREISVVSRRAESPRAIAVMTCLVMFVGGVSW